MSQAKAGDYVELHYYILGSRQYVTKGRITKRLNTSLRFVPDNNEAYDFIDIETQSPKPLDVNNVPPCVVVTGYHGSEPEVILSEGFFREFSSIIDIVSQNLE